MNKPDDKPQGLVPDDNTLSQADDDALTEAWRHITPEQIAEAERELADFHPEDRKKKQRKGK